MFPVRVLRQHDLRRGPPLWTFFTDREHIVRWAISTRRTPRERMPALALEAPHLTIVRLRSDREIDDWLAGPLRAAAG